MSVRPLQVALNVGYLTSFLVSKLALVCIHGFVAEIGVGEAVNLARCVQSFFSGGWVWDCA